MSEEIFETYGKDPVTLCRQWYEEAEKSELNDPEAVCLATCDAQGNPSNRMVLLKEMNESGFKFHTNEESRKGRDIAENPKGAMCLYWKSTRKQIRISGEVIQVDPSETDDYFATRSIERRIGAWASMQSKPFDHLEEMEKNVKKFEKEFADQDNIPRPPYWKGYRLIPETMEFWIAHKDRLHTRFVYTKTTDGWTATWLCP